MLFSTIFNKKNYFKLLLLILIFEFNYELHFVSSITENEKNKKINEVNLICVTSSVLEDSCENRIYDITPIIFVEGLYSERSLKKK